jgi:hypothetical protein
MRCRRAQAHIALWVGDDLEEPTLSRLREHVDGCPKCRAHADGMRGVLDVLGCRPDAAADGVSGTGPSFDEFDEPGESLWPRLSRQLPKLARDTPPAADFNGWYPALAVAAVCLLIVTSAREAPPPAASQAGAEAGPMWSVGTVVTPHPVGSAPNAGGSPRAAEPVAGWEELNRRRAFEPFDFPQEGMPFGGGLRGGGLRGPADPMMIYAGER